MPARLATTELNALRERMALLENRVLQLQEQLRNGTGTSSNPSRSRSRSSMSDEEFHKYNEVVRKIIEQNRKRDRKQSIAQHDVHPELSKPSKRQKRTVIAKSRKAM